MDKIGSLKFSKMRYQIMLEIFFLATNTHLAPELRKYICVGKFVNQASLLMIRLNVWRRKSRQVRQNQHSFLKNICVSASVLTFSFPLEIYYDNNEKEWPN